MKTNKTTMPNPARRIAAVARYFGERVDPTTTCDGWIVKHPDGSAVWCMTVEEHRAQFPAPIRPDETVAHDGLIFVVFSV
jgi:hypothetical protein